MAITANLVGNGRRSSAETSRSATASADCSEARVISVSASPVAARRPEDPEGPEAPPKGGLGGWVPPGAGGVWGGSSPPRGSAADGRWSAPRDTLTLGAGRGQITGAVQSTRRRRGCQLRTCGGARGGAPNGPRSP